MPPFPSTSWKRCRPRASKTALGPPALGQFWRPLGGIFSRMSREKVAFCTKSLHLLAILVKIPQTCKWAFWVPLLGGTISCAALGRHAALGRKYLVDLKSWLPIWRIRRHCRRTRTRCAYYGGPGHRHRLLGKRRECAGKRPRRQIFLNGQLYPFCRRKVRHSKQ